MGWGGVGVVQGLGGMGVGWVGWARMGWCGVG